MNRDLLKNPSSLYDSQSAVFVDEIVAAMTVAPDESSKIAAYFQRFKDFALTLGKPSMKKRYVHDLSPPSSSDINLTMQEVKRDIGIAFSESYMLGQGAVMNYDFTVTERAKLSNRLKSVAEKIGNYVVLSKNAVFARGIVIKDTFNTEEKIDKSKGNVAKIHTDEGFVTLSIQSAMDMANNAGAVASVNPFTDIQGNGLPSNFGVVKSILSGSSGVFNEVMDPAAEKDKDTYEMVWITDKHDDPAVIFDGNKDTWFEYGAINLNPETPKTTVCMGYGLKFDNGDPIYKAPSGNNLIMNITMTLPYDEAVDINWLKVRPYFFTDNMNQSSSKYGFFIDDILVSAGGDKITDFVSVLQPADKGKTIFQDMAPIDKNFPGSDSYKGTAIYSFPTKKARYVKVNMRTDGPYQTMIGHIWYEQKWVETTQNSTLLGLIKLGQSSKTQHIRIEGPSTPKALVGYSTTISRWSAGAADAVQNAFDKGKDKNLAEGLKAAGLPPLLEGIDNLIKGGVKLAAGVIAGINGLVASIFYGSNITTSNIEVIRHTEAFPGDRWAIGIRDIEILANVYSPSSSLVSTNFRTSKEIAQVALEVEEYVPDEFWIDDQSLKNQWIKYYLSFDSGQTWSRISPKNQRAVGVENEDFPNQVISVNSDVHNDFRSTSVTYTETSDACKNIMFRADLSRPTDLTTDTPKLMGYKIIISPREVAQ